MRGLLRFGVVVAALAAGPAAAQPEPAAREVVLTGVPDERPVTVYGSPDVALTLLFDAPLERTDAGVTALLPGADVRQHPYRADGLVVTPSKLLFGPEPALLRVPLVDGAVALALAASPDRVDQVLSVIRRPFVSDAGTELQQGDVEGALRIAADTVLGYQACNPLRPSLPRPERVNQNPLIEDWVEACVAGPLSYLRVARKRPRCIATSARLLHGRRDLEVFALGPVKDARGTSHVLVVKTPQVRSTDLELLLIAADGTLCERYVRVTLQPGGAP